MKRTLLKYEDIKGTAREKRLAVVTDIALIVLIDLIAQLKKQDRTWRSGPAFVKGSLVNILNTLH